MSLASVGASRPANPESERGRIRVVLAGRTVLDQALRRDARVELARAHTALGAVGELSVPADGAASSAVVITDSAEPAHDAPRLIAALRAVDPKVTVVRLRGGAAGAPASPAYDAVVNESAGAEALVAALAPVAARAEAPAMTPATPPGAAAPLMPTPVVRAGFVPGTPMGASVDDAGDAAMVQALLGGRDLLPVAMGLLRLRTGDPALVYHAGSQPLPAAGAAVVQHRGHVFGTLISAALGEAARSAHAAWLAGWLALAHQQEQLRVAALTDELTGAWNRRYFDRFMETALPQALAARQPLTLLIFDIDNFKQYNDQFGHPAGDEILKHTVALLKSVIRTHDKVCRVGGDEFAVIFYSPDGPRDPASKPPGEVYTIVRRFQQQVSSSRFPKLGKDAPGRLSVSGGLATFPWDGRTAAELLQHADQLALQSKRHGKGQLILGPDEQDRGPATGAPGA
jgi:diguanylate cyclase (GGDEF)-like protein